MQVRLWPGGSGDNGISSDRLAVVCSGVLVQPGPPSLETCCAFAYRLLHCVCPRCLSAPSYLVLGLPKPPCNNSVSLLYGSTTVFRRGCNQRRTGPGLFSAGMGKNAGIESQLRYHGMRALGCPPMARHCQGSGFDGLVLTPWLITDLNRCPLLSLQSFCGGSWGL